MNLIRTGKKNNGKNFGLAKYSGKITKKFPALEKNLENIPDLKNFDKKSSETIRELGNSQKKFKKRFRAQKNSLA